MLIQYFYAHLPGALQLGAGVNAGDQIATHVRDSVDVLLIVHSGSGVVVVDGTEHALRTDHVLVVPSGASRSIRATTQFVYYSIHQPHEGLVIRR